MLLGLLLVTRVDEAGRGALAHVCPFLILAGYVLIALGLWQRPSPPASR